LRGRDYTESSLDEPVVVVVVLIVVVVMVVVVLPVPLLVLVLVLPAMVPALAIREGALS
jgi:hypothetical protein